MASLVAQRRQVDTRKEWACQYISPNDAFTYFVAVYGHEPTQIYAVNALFLSNNGVGSFPLALDFLQPVASVPYDDGDPEAAGVWVQENISTTDAKRTFGSAAFSMYGLSFVKILEMVAVAPG